MDKRFAIFDMDGTLVDSMIYWKHLATEFLESKGVQTISPDILERIKPMTMTESAALFIQEYSLSGTAESVAAEMNAMMDEHYRKDIPLKPGVHAYLEALHNKGVVMCVASATAEELMDACKQFESYFLEQMFKQMWATVPESELSSGSSNALVDYYKDEMTRTLAEQSTEQNSLGLAQMLYEQMKRNYDL